MSSHQPAEECTFSYALQLRRMRYTAPRLVIHSIPVGVLDHVDVVGDPEMACYEWVVLRDHQVATHSDAGYGSPEAALRDGLIKYLGLPENSREPAAACEPLNFGPPGLTRPVSKQQPTLPQAVELVDPEERRRVWAETAAGNLELAPLPRDRQWTAPSRRSQGGAS